MANEMTTSEFEAERQFTQRGIKAAQEQRCCGRDLYLEEQNVSELSLHRWRHDTLFGFELQLLFDWAKITFYIDTIRKRSKQWGRGLYDHSISLFYFVVKKNHPVSFDPR